MGQKCNPIGNRLGFIKGWDSNWYGGNNYGDKIVEDDKIRKYLMARLKKASVSKIVIERTLKLVTVTINTARPGVIIGKAGTEVDKLKEELKKSRVRISRSTFLRSSVLSSMHALYQTEFVVRSKVVSATVVPSKWQFRLLCAWVQRESKLP